MQRGGRTGQTAQLIIFGLGNPGARYASTRHNAGWWVLDELARRHRASGGYNRHQSLVQQCEITGLKLLLVKPQTYMNASGDALTAWRREYPDAQWILVFDDTSLPPGEIRLKRNGSAGGHNGVESVIERLKTQQFDRLKLGIGPPPHPGALADYVLSAPTSVEGELLTAAVAKGADTLERYALHGFDRAAQHASGGDEKQARRRELRAAQLTDEASRAKAEGSTASETTKDSVAEDQKRQS